MDRTWQLFTRAASKDDLVRDQIAERSEKQEAKQVETVEAGCSCHPERDATLPAA